MKALTVRQPWASLIACRAKRYITLRYASDYRGPLAIHAGLAYTADEVAAAAREPAWSALRASRIHGHGLHHANLPRGAVVAVVRLVAVREIFETVHKVIGLGGDYHALHPRMRAAELGLVNGTERAMGDWDSRRPRFAWVLEDTVGLEAPMPARGGRGLWEWTPPVDSPVLVQSVHHLDAEARRLNEGRR